MSPLIHIYRRELAAVAKNPGVYVVTGLFLFLVSTLTIYGLEDYARRSTADYPLSAAERMDFTQTLVGASFGAVSILFVFVIPILTMRAFAEERRSGMSELLAAWPIRDWELILGKFLSLSTVVLAIDALMLVYVAVFYIMGRPDTGVVVTAYTGLVLLSLAYVSLGLFASILTENQIIAAVIAFAALFFFWMIHNLGGGGTSLFSRLCDAASISLHFTNFVKGAVAPTDFVYFVGFIGFWLFLTARAFEARKGRL